VKILIFINRTVYISMHKLIVVVLICSSTFFHFSLSYTTTTTKIISIIVLSTTGTIIRIGLKDQTRLDTQQKYNSFSHHRVHT